MVRRVLLAAMRAQVRPELCRRQHFSVGAGDRTHARHANVHDADYFGIVGSLAFHLAALSPISVVESDADKPLPAIDQFAKARPRSGVPQNPDLKMPPRSTQPVASAHNLNAGKRHNLWVHIGLHDGSLSIRI